CDPEFRPARLNRGVMYWLSGQLDKALKDFDDVLQPPQEKQLIEAAYYRGQVYLQLPKKEALALEDFHRVLTARPDFGPAYLSRARVHLIQGNQDAALRDLDAFLGGKRSPEERGRLLRLVITRLPSAVGQKSWALALADLRQAVETGPASAALY